MLDDAPLPSDAIIDNRFGALFKRKEFEIDEKAEDYMLRHPVKSAFQLEKESKRAHGAGQDEEEDGLYDNEEGNE